MPISSQRRALSLLIPLLPLGLSPAEAQSGGQSSECPTDQADRDRIAEMIRLQRLITVLRDLEADSRELYYGQSFILLYLHGNRTERVGSYDAPPRMLTAAVQSRFVPKIKRLKVRVDKMDGLNAEQKSLLAEVIASLEEAIEAGYEIAEHMRDDELGAATQLFHDRSLPAFRIAWRNLYTIISKAERDFPRI